MNQILRNWTKNTLSQIWTHLIKSLNKQQLECKMRRNNGCQLYIGYRNVTPGPFFTIFLSMLREIYRHKVTKTIEVTQFHIPIEYFEFLIIFKGKIILFAKHMRIQSRSYDKNTSFEPNFILEGNLISILLPILKNLCYVNGSLNL